METVRVSWTDERLDDLNHKVDEMNREMHAEFRAVRGEMNNRFDAMQRQLTLLTTGMVAGFVSLFAAIIAGQL